MAEWCGDVYKLRGAAIQRGILALSLRCGLCSSPDNEKRHVKEQLIVFFSLATIFRLHKI